MAPTIDQITNVLGPVGRDVASAIVATDASLADLEGTWAWLENDEAFVNEGRSLPTGKVAMLIGILSPPVDDAS